MRNKKEYKKYKLGKIYFNKDLGYFKVVSITDMIDIDWSPVYNYLTESQIKQIRKYGKNGSTKMGFLERSKNLNLYCSISSKQSNY